MLNFTFLHFGELQRHERQETDTIVFTNEIFRLRPVISQTITSHLCGKPFDQSEFELFIILRDNFSWSESQHVYNNQIYHNF